MDIANILIQNSRLWECSFSRIYFMHLLYARRPDGWWRKSRRLACLLLSWIRTAIWMSSRRFILMRASRCDRLRGESTLSLARTFNATVPQWTGRFADESPLIETKILVPARTNQEIALKLGVDVEPGGCYWLVVGAAPGISWRGIEEHLHHDQFHQSAISRPIGFHAAFRHPKYGWVRYCRSISGKRKILSKRGRYRKTSGLA